MDRSVWPIRAPALVLPLLVLLFALWPADPAWAACGDPGQDACPCGFLNLGRCCDYDYLVLIGECSDSSGFPVFCGGANEPACTILQHTRACKPGLSNVAGTCRQLDADGFPSFCGGEGERPCTIVEHIPSCKSGLLEIPFPGGNCTRLDADGFPTFCGGLDEPPCSLVIQAQLLITSCKSGLAEIPFPGGPCKPLDAEGYPTFCGDFSEPACDLGLQIQLGITSCKPRLIEVSGTCDGLDADGYPTRCGDVGEPGCPLDVQVILGKPSCKESTVAGREVVEIPPVDGSCVLLDEDGFPPFCGDDQERPCLLFEHIPSCKPEVEEFGGICQDTFPADCGRNGQRHCITPFDDPEAPEHLFPCKSALSIRHFDFGECGRDPESWPADEVPRGGPRTVFYVHGRGGDLSNLADGGSQKLAHHLKFMVPNVRRLYGVDWNAGLGSEPRKLTIRELVRDETATCEPIPDPSCDARTERCVGFPGIACADASDCFKACRGGPNDGLACAAAGADCALGTVDTEFGTESFDASDFRVHEIARALSEAIKTLPTGPNITIVTTSYGGVIGRHLVYRHYDELRRAGKRIAEVVTVVAPHLGGGMAIPSVQDGELVQNGLACAVDTFEDVFGDPLPILGGSAVWHNVCELGLWHEFRKRRQDGILGPPFGAIHMDDRDYPQVRWVAVAENGDRLVVLDDLASFIPDPETLPSPLDEYAIAFLSKKSQLDGLDSDGVIATESEFGIRMDECYPFTRASGPQGLPIEIAPVFRVNTIDPDGAGGDPPFELPVSSAQCHHPAARVDSRYTERTELTGLAHSPHDPDILDFVAAVLSLPGDTNGDGVVDDRDLRPVADAGPDRSLECTGALTDVTLDGSASSDPGRGGLTYEWTGAPGRFDGVGPTVQLPVGTATITLTIDDSLGNTDSDEVSIAVEDTTAPVVDADLDVVLEATSTSGAPFTVVPLAADDLCGPVTVAIAPDATLFSLGVTEVAVTATDAQGNGASDALTITVRDTTPPEIAAPAGVNVEANAVLSLVLIGMATATDIFPVTVTNDAPEGGFPLGETPVTWTATDANGNTGTAIQMVTVVDTTPPRVTAPADVIAEANAVLSSVAIGTATATDIFAVTISDDAPPLGFPLGETAVIWIATDSHGNEASATQRVTVVDTTPPALTVPADVSVEASGPLTAVALGAATATDIFEPVAITNDAPAAGFPPGETEVTWTATDANGNSASKTQRVAVSYRFDGLVPPLEDGGIYKATRTLPVKFGLSYSDGTLVTTAVGHIQVIPLGADDTPGEPIEVESAAAADAGTTFRFTGEHYLFNLDTKSLPQGRYRIVIALDDGRTYSADVILR